MKQTLFMMFLASLFLISCQKEEYLIKDSEVVFDDDFVNVPYNPSKPLYPLYPLNKNKNGYTITWDVEDGIIWHSNYPGKQFRNYYHWWYPSGFPGPYCEIEIATGAELSVNHLPENILVIEGVKPSSIEIEGLPIHLSNPYSGQDGLQRPITYYRDYYNALYDWLYSQGVVKVHIKE